MPLQSTALKTPFGEANRGESVQSVRAPNDASTAALALPDLGQGKPRHVM